MTPHAHRTDTDLDLSLARLLTPMADAAPMPERSLDVPRSWVGGTRWRRPLRFVAVAATMAVATLLVAFVIRLPELPVAGTGSLPELPVTGTGSLLDGVEISIQTDQPLRMAPGDAARIADSRLRQAEERYGQALAPIRILSITAIPADRVDEVVPRVGAPLDTDQIVWVVQAEGTFVASEIVPGETELRTSTIGQYIIWDRDGRLDSWGF